MSWIRRLGEGAARRLGLDLRALALLRVLLGALTLIDLATRLPNIDEFYTDAGVLPVGPYVQEFANRLHISLHLASGTMGWQLILFGVHAVIGLCLLTGYRTRLATVLCWLMLVSLHNRNTLVLNGGDVLFRMIVFWSMFLPLSARWSVDAALSEPQPPRPTGAAANLLFTGGTLALVMQVLYVYVTTAILKDGKEWLPDGTASFFALSLDAFVTPFGLWMRQWLTALQYTTYLVYALELIGPFLLFSPLFFVPLRTLILAAFIFMHLNFELAMRLGLFPWVDMTLLVALLPGELFDWLERRWTTAARCALTIYYDGDCGFCKKAVYLLREAYLIKDTRIVAAQTDAAILATMQREHSWVVVDAAGRTHLRWDALVTTLEHMPILGGLLRRLPLRALTPVGDACYRAIASRRPQLGRLTAALLPWRNPPSLRPSLLGNGLAIFFCGFVGLWNLKSIPRAGIDIVAPWNKLAYVLRLDQKWNMFAPFPLKEDGWYVIPGELADGTKVDVMTQTVGPVSFVKPPLVAYEKYENARWRKYLMSIWSKKKAGHRLYYGKFLCRRWNADAESEAKKLKRFEIFYMKELSNPPGQEPTLSKHSIWRHDCFKKSGGGKDVATVPTSVPTSAPTSSPTLRPAAAAPATSMAVGTETGTATPSSLGETPAASAPGEPGGTYDTNNGKVPAAPVEPDAADDEAKAGESKASDDDTPDAPGSEPDSAAL